MNDASLERSRFPRDRAVNAKVPRPSAGRTQAASAGPVAVAEAAIASNDAEAPPKGSVTSRQNDTNPTNPKERQWSALAARRPAKDGVAKRPSRSDPFDESDASGFLTTAEAGGDEGAIELRLPTRSGTPVRSSGVGAAGRKRSRASFVAFVVLPTICAAVYYFLFAKDQYVTEFRFSVTEQAPALPGSQQGPTNTMTAGNAGSSSGSSTSMTTVSNSLFSGSSSSSGSMQNFVVTDYVTSREAVEELQRRIDIKSLYGRGSRGDIWLSFDSNAPMEQFAAYWAKMVESYYDPVTSLAYVRVRAFSPGDALLIGNTMMQLSEQLVNDIANRANKDAVHFAELDVERAKQRLDEASKKLLEIRDADKAVNPNLSLVQANTSAFVAQKVAVSQLRSQLASLKAQSLSPDSSLARAFQAEIAAGSNEMRRLENENKNLGAQASSLSGIVGRYEQADLERQNAAAGFSNALLALDQARANAAAQHLYLTPYSKPYLPQSSTYPARFTNILIVFIACFFAWLIGLLLVRAVLDHES
jgi:capsular polysaccharide transport system permease protein